jgi:3-deoxy-D-arabino-heptulosonate 7-phosphate (DAHP) synthase
MQLMQKKIIIAGPCAAESKEQIERSVDEAQKRNLLAARISLWKPRTEPGFEGLKEKGIEFFNYAERKGVIPATEVMCKENVREILKYFPSSKIIFWIGSRNQNHFIQKEIAEEVSKNKNAFLLIKNQPWEDKRHWIGILKHIEETEIKRERIILCHRGFSLENSENYRNVPNYKMAMEVKEETKLPMIIDFSHIGGSVLNVFKVASEAKKYNFDGMMIEVHPSPEKAMTDTDQQISWEEFDLIMKDFN